MKTKQQEKYHGSKINELLKRYAIAQIEFEKIVGFEKAEFYVTNNGDLTMSLDGMFVDHKWNKGTFVNK